MADGSNPPSRVEVAANDCQGRPRSGDLEWIQIPRVLSSDGTGTDLDSPVALRPRAVLTYALQVIKGCVSDSPVEDNYQLFYQMSILRRRSSGYAYVKSDVSASS